MDNIVITFCVPSYNRAEKTLMTVESILKCPRDDIEVVVTDNCSPDDTIEKLGSISDPRLHIRVNRENIGAPANFLESLKFGSGKYKFVILSRETIISDKIPDLIAFLNKKNFSLVYCGEDDQDRENEIFVSKSDAIKHFGYRDLHPTGYIFNNKMLMDILKDVDLKECSSKYRNFPHEFLAVELALKGNAAFYNKRIRVRVDEKYMKESKSAFSDSERKVWFFPEEQIAQFKLYLAHLSRLDISNKMKSKIVGRCYLSKLVCSTYSYKSRMADKIICNHYNIAEKNITRSEMFYYSSKLKETAKEEIRKNNIPINVLIKAEIALSKPIVLLYPLLSKVKHCIFKH